jgi:hypothetical protein
MTEILLDPALKSICKPSLVRLSPKIVAIELQFLEKSRLNPKTALIL